MKNLPSNERDAGDTGLFPFLVMNITKKGMSGEVIHNLDKVKDMVSTNSSP